MNLVAFAAFSLASSSTSPTNALPPPPAFNHSLTLPPLSLSDSLRRPPAALQLLAPRLAAADRSPIPTTSANRPSLAGRTGMPVLEPRADIDFKITAVPPDPAIDFKTTIVRPADPRESTPPPSAPSSSGR